MNDGLYATNDGLFLRHADDAFGPLGEREALRLQRVAASRGLGERKPQSMPGDARALPPSEVPASATRYELHGAPESIPVDWTQLPEARRREVCRAAGLDPDDAGLPNGRLREAWNLHPAGSPVITTMLLQGHQLTVIDEPG